MMKKQEQALKAMAAREAVKGVKTSAQIISGRLKNRESSPEELNEMSPVTMGKFRLPIVYEVV